MADIPRLLVVSLSLSMAVSSPIVHSLKPRIARRSCAIARGAVLISVRVIDVSIEVQASVRY